MSADSSNRQWKGDKIPIDQDSWHTAFLIRKPDNSVYVKVVKDNGSTFEYNGTLPYPDDTKSKLSIFSYWGCQVDYVAVAKYADQEPIATVEQMSISTWKVTIHNPNNYSLTDFQIKINGTGIVNSKNDSLLITNSISNEKIPFKVISADNKTGFVQIEVFNISNKIDYFTVNWDDGTIERINNTENKPEYILNHTYDLYNIAPKELFKIIVDGYNASGDVIAINQSTIHLILPFDKFINESNTYYEIRIANPYNENITNYDLKLVLTGDNFNFWDNNLKPLGTNIFFRDKNHYLKHYIEYWSLSDAKAIIHVNIPLIEANSYKSFYMGIANHDIPQHTFVGDNRTLLYIIIPHHAGTKLQTTNNSLILKSADIMSFKNITVLFVDENSLVAGCTKSGIIQFVDDDGHKVVYSFQSPALAIVQVSNLTKNGTIIVTTSDGIVRKVRYSDAPGFANVILIPNYAVAPLYVRGSGHVVVKTGGFIVTEDEAPCTIPLAIGQTYDIYIDGTKVRTITMTEPTTVTAIPTVIPNNVIIYSDIKRINDTTVEHTIITSVNAKILVKNGTDIILEKNIPANTKTVIKAPIGTEYEIYVNNTLIKKGIYEKRDLGLLTKLKDWISEKWYMIFATILVLFTVWAGTWISAHVAVMLATFEIMVFTYLDVFKFDPITKTIVLILSALMFVIMWMKR